MTKINEVHKEEAKRLIELFLRRSIEDHKSLIILNPQPFRLAFKITKENALKCCDEVIRSTDSMDAKKHYESVKQAIKEFEL